MQGVLNSQKGICKRSLKSEGKQAAVLPAAIFECIHSISGAD